MPSTLRKSLEPDADFAFAEFGLSEEQFFRQTPRQWQRRLAAWQRKKEREIEIGNRQTARVCMVLAWCHGWADATEEHFIPGPIADDEQSPEEMIAVLASFNQHG